MLVGELAERLEDVLLDRYGLLLGISGIIRHDRRREVRAVNGVVDGHRNLVLGVVIDHTTCNTGPHGLDAPDERTIDHSVKRKRTWRLAYPGTLGRLEEATLESRRRAATEGLDSKICGGAMTEKDEGEKDMSGGREVI